MNPFVQEKNRRIVDAAILIVIGVFMCFFPRFTGDVFALVIGIMCVVFGAFYLFAYFWSFLIHDPWLLLAGIVLMILGICILNNPNTFLYISVYAASLYMMFTGISELAYSIDLAQLHIKNWWVDLVAAIIIFGLGLSLIIVDASNGNSVNLLMIFGGASLILEGLLEFLLIFVLHRDFKRVHKVVSEQ